MKIKYFLSFTIVCFVLILSSCSDDDNFTYSIQPNADEIGLTVDTFHIATKQIGDSPILSKISAESWIIGSYTNDTWGTTTGELLAQFEPINFSLPSNTYNHKLILTLKYTSSVHQVSDSTVHLKIYRMDKNTFTYKASYYSDINPLDYSSESELLGEITTNVSSSGTITDTLSDEIATEFYQKMTNSPSIFESSSAFNEFFKGVYIKVESGTNAIMAVSAATMTFKYSYESSGSTITYYNSFSANKDVRQVNHIVHSNSPVAADGYFYITSPAGQYAEVTLPFSRMKDRLSVTSDGSLAYLSNNGKKIAVNNALVTFSAVDSSISYPSYLMLVKKSVMTNFFATSSLPDNINSIIGSYDSSTETYSFTLKYLLADVFKKGDFSDETYCIVPVDVTLSSSSYVTAVKSETSFTALKLKSGTNSDPLRLNVMVSGF